MDSPIRNQVPPIDTTVTASNFSFSARFSPFDPLPNDIFPSRLITTQPPPAPPSPLLPEFSKINDKARNESRKLLAHVLGQLERRNLPPPFHDILEYTETQASGHNLEVIMETVKDAVRLGNKKRDAKHPIQRSWMVDDDSGSVSVEESVFSTEGTYDLLVQLKDVLFMSVAQGWHIFDDIEDGSLMQQHLWVGEKPKSPFHRSRGGLQPGGRRSRSPSPSPMHARPIQASELLFSCISILASVVLEDCRYKIASPRPSRPPNALQSLTLDVAQFLLHTHAHHPHIIAKIGFAIIPAFTTFQPEMHGRLLNFFESAVVRGMLNGLRGVDDISQSHDQLDGRGSPYVSISISAAQETADTVAPSKWVPWPTLSSQSLKLSPTATSLQSLSLCYLSSMIPPLFTTILEIVDLDSSTTESDVLHRFRHLLHLILEKKVDAYNDFLQVVAYHTPRARRHALKILHTFWPRAIGHIVLSQPLDHRLHFGIPSSQILLNSMPQSHSHQFAPWRFASERNGLHTCSHSVCRCCGNPLRDFGLLCPFCMCAVHFDCYDHPEGSHLVQYTLASNPDIKRVAMYRFSGILTNAVGTQAGTISRQSHDFRLVNIFTVTLCFVCQKPLWGCTMQGWNCTSCMHFIHTVCLSSDKELPSCSSAPHNSHDLAIEWHELRKSCINFYQPILGLSSEELGALSFEEINLLYTTMWTQLQLVTNGIALGSIVVLQNGKKTNHTKAHQLDEFELHRIVKWCETHLLHDKQPLSNALEDYLIENSLERGTHLLMFDWSSLVYICSLIKSPPPLLHISSHIHTDRLSDNQQNYSLNYRDGSPQPSEVVSLSHIRDIIGQEFNIRSDLIARILLSHLYQVGLFDLINHKPLLFDDGDIKTTYISIPLPFGLDLSAEVETLISAVEVCLSDIDLSVNESGFLLLRRGLWPNGLVSEYTLRRLTRSIVAWILDEDDKLSNVLREYLMKQGSLPGVRSAHEKVPWLSSQTIRPTQPGSMANGGDYIATRRSLLTRYAITWLLNLHDNDSVASVVMIYEACEGSARTERNSTDDGTRTLSVHNIYGGMNQPKSTMQKDYLNRSERILRAIIKLTQASIGLGIFDELFLSWLTSVSALGFTDGPAPSLVRLFSSETGDIQSHHQPHTLGQVISRPDIDPWRGILRIASESKEGFSRSLSWLYFLARNEVDISRAMFMQFSALARQFDSSFDDSTILTKAVLCSLWTDSAGHQELQTLFSELHARLAPQIIDCLKHKRRALESKHFIRISLGACLLLYGCDRRKVMDLHMIDPEELEGIPSQRKGSRVPAMRDPVTIDPQLMSAVERYISSHDNDVSSLVAMFLHTFMTNSPYLEPYEVDNFILRNGRILAVCAWEFYGVQSHEISDIRTNFLLRTLVVDSEPFQDVLRQSFLPTCDWERRLDAITRLSRVILDVTSPAFNVEDRQWQSSVAEIFYCFFTAMLSEEREEVRIAAYAFSSSLFPTHFDVISVCWSALLMTSPIMERIRLVSFLVQLHPYFPTWQVLAWDAILETLSNTGVDDPFGYDKHGSVAHTHNISSFAFGSRSVDPEICLLRTSILQLSLQLIADGVAIDSSTLLRIKFHLAQTIGFTAVSAVPSLNGNSFHVEFRDFDKIPTIALPCIGQFFRMFDAHYHVELLPSSMMGHIAQDDRPASILVGSVFVDLFLAMFSAIRDFTSLPLLTLKGLLETLCVIVYKHDFENKVQRHLQQPLRRAVSRVLDLLSEAISYDIRQLALSLVQAFIKRCHTFMGPIIFTAIESAVKLVASQEHYGQDALVVQANSFINTALTIYAQNGLFHNLLKRQLDPGFFGALKIVIDLNTKNKRTLYQPSLPELLLRDVLGRLVESDQASFQTALNNSQSYIEIVFHHNYSADLLLYAGQQLTYIARRICELAPGAIDANPILIILAVLIQHNKVHCRTLAPYIDTVLGILLNRLSITASSLVTLLRNLGVMFRRPQSTDSTQMPTTFILMFEALTDALKLKSRMLPSTLKAMVEAIRDVENTEVLAHFPSLLGLVEPGIYYLRTSLWVEVNSENDFSASLAVARMLLRVTRQDWSPLAKLSDRSGEKLTHTSFRIRAWNMLAVAALLEPEEDGVTILLAQLTSFSYAYHAGMRAYALLESTVPEPSTGDIDHAFIAIKLWILMAQRLSTTQRTGDPLISVVWNELWPPFEGLVRAFEGEARTERHMTLWTLVMSSVADLFVFLRTLNTPITVKTSAHMAALNRLRDLGPGEIATPKLTRAIKYMSETPPETSFGTLVNQVAKDIVAAEKLRVLESRYVQDRRTTSS